MAPYLATATLGRFDLTVSHTSAGVPSYVAVDPQLAKGQVLSKLPEAVRLYSSLYGPYPFNAVGAIVDSAKVVGYSLETQTKPVFDHMPDEATLVHELSHQWFGDSVSVATWDNIWLNEGFASFSEFLWAEETGLRTAHEQFVLDYSRAADNPFWTVVVSDPQRDTMFASAVYRRGGMTLQALREKIGNDDTFFRILKTWTAKYRYGNATTADFIALSEQISGLDLDQFFHVWLDVPAKPTSW